MAGAKGHRRTAAEWRQLIDELDDGAEALAAFCRRKGVKLSTLQWWRWRLRTAGRPTRGGTAPGRREPLRVWEAAMPRVTDRGPQHSGCFELRWSDGLCLRVPSDFDAEALRRLLDVLEADGC